MRQWRHDFHAHPETAFEEHRTAAKVAELLKSFGIEVHTGLAKTGVVGVLDGNISSDRCIGLRADMDALNLQELNQFKHCSTHQGKMHGCGHDGHTAMLLGAACYLAEHRDFAGRVVFIFQPAEEGENGAEVMCQDGLFDLFPVDAIYGIHNWPGVPTGSFAIHQTAVMASMDVFDIEITGRGSHGAMPHAGVDPVVVAGQLITSLQSIVGRSLDPQKASVVSITQMQGGDAYNVIPESVTLSGTCRTFCAETQDKIEHRMQQHVEHICEAYGATGKLNYRRISPATINQPEHANICINTALSLVSTEQVITDLQPSMASEDFSFMLQRKPGAYFWLGNGNHEQSKGLHNPYYDFNDEILPLGASFWIALAKLNN
ncbi:amidohydrolase [Pelagibaculum spongiae]|uniref:Amidohydrolase n=2 Tax=Pelagibaculum spongiae TaxID=2080658 RepID=A0A2V1GYP3_9GAMM|nr:M20 aminoacylase family protein [Pelagibaculum spongiae]PVZ67804.1 amidohydrolase [Pelagibaculum spongiae]